MRGPLPFGSVPGFLPLPASDCLWVPASDSCFVLLSSLQIMIKFWSQWHDFEVAHGNEDTFTDMLRVKRTVQAQFSQANYMAAEMLTEAPHIVSDAEAAQQEAEKAARLAGRTGGGSGGGGGGGAGMSAMERSAANILKSAVAVAPQKRSSGAMLGGEGGGGGNGGGESTVAAEGAGGDAVGALERFKRGRVTE
jgi:pre-mRNA-splicing factor SYF1